jgi:predicted Zn-dependent protease
MRADWNGHYLDGQSPARHPARIRIARTGLQITLTDTGAELFWPLTQVRQTQGVYAGERVRLERGGDTPEVLSLREAAFLSALRELAPDTAAAFHDPRRRRFRVQLTLVLALATVGLAVALYLWLIPAGAALAATLVPVPWEAALGEAVLRELAPPERRCTDPERMRAIDAIMARLLAAAPGQPYTFRVAVVNHSMVNALAAPGGAIVIFRGLLERTSTPEELAGVLAHEIQHVLHRHTTKMVFQQASTAVLLAAVTGDVTGVMAYGADAARVLGALRYTRGFEEEADREAMRMLRAARLDPAGMLAFFRELERLEGGRATPGVFRYLRSHPSAEDRLQTLTRLAAGAPPASPLLADRNWQDVRAMCGPPATPRRR